jgi:hypothetical protein
MDSAGTVAKFSGHLHQALGVPEPVNRRDAGDVNLRLPGRVTGGEHIEAGPILGFEQARIGHG